ncbi:hypothetical protein EOT10_30260 [Streptomyces antnestii]|uniref:Uncharacterized protein n=1 Tax=Streptomyces antnestii TaxID=2494256 RepID=A0A3S2WCL3_9ACTN|nr:hypothetical protein [Streptomyces sp. San01]RVU19270.1 hypothetical protein EOT10_30260 [Streptomyces sp. San01]
MSKHCPNCKGPLQDFRPANDREKAHLVNKEQLKWADAHSYWRCQGNEGKCRWIQPHLNQSKGTTLPESIDD